MPPAGRVKIRHKLKGDALVLEFHLEQELFTRMGIIGILNVTEHITLARFLRSVLYIICGSVVVEFYLDQGLFARVAIIDVMNVTDQITLARYVRGLDKISTINRKRCSSNSNGVNKESGLWIA